MYKTIQLDGNTERISKYNENGDMMWEREYMDNKPHGKSMWYYAHTGIKRKECYYKNGQPHGKSTWWYENGDKSYEVEYQNGIANGEYRLWCYNSKMTTRAQIKNGKLHGTFFISTDDDKKIIGEYYNAKLISGEISWNISGKKCVSCKVDVSDDTNHLSSSSYKSIARRELVKYARVIEINAKRLNIIEIDATDIKGYYE